MMKRFVLIIFVFILLTACVTQPTGPKPKPMTWSEHKNYVENTHRWHTQGMIGIRTSQESNSASFDWRQCDKDYEIHLFGPFGAGATMIMGDGHDVALTNSQNQTFVARSPEALLKQQTNFDLPISHLYYWLRGLPAPKVPAKITFTQNQRIQRLVQDGWVIDYLRYDNVKGVDLPGKIAIEYPNLHIKIVVERWVMKAC